MKRMIAFYREFTSFEGSLFIYSLSFSLLLALAPSLIIFVMLFNFAYIQPDILVNFMEQFIPAQFIGEFMEFIIPKEYNLIPAILTLCTSFWLASRSVYSFLLISAQHEEVIELPKWAIRIKAIYLFACLAVMVVAAIWIGTKLNQYLPLVSSAIMFILFTVSYRALSFRKRNASYGIIGGLFATIAILGLAALFFKIVNTFTRYETLYGSLASLVTLLLSIYIISWIIYFGFCLNIVFEEDYQNESALKLKSQGYYELCEKINHKFFKRMKRKY